MPAGSAGYSGLLRADCCQSRCGSLDGEEHNVQVIQKLGPPQKKARFFPWGEHGAPIYIYIYGLIYK